jgi:hypothetical protein
MACQRKIQRVCRIFLIQGVGSSANVKYLVEQVPPDGERRIQLFLREISKKKSAPGRQERESHLGGWGALCRCADARSSTEVADGRSAISVGTGFHDLRSL